MTFKSLGKQLSLSCCSLLVGEKWTHCDSKHYRFGITGKAIP